ncbi:MAG TPA: NAD(P)-dependent oxidoreductase [Thermoanaerobaculia bacterium]|nr:NAD(P)-dependent oxidoreductase [Thermoanaerobaculia bacterium]
MATGDGYTTQDVERLTAAGFDVMLRSEIGGAELQELLPSIGVYILGGNERLGADLLETARRLKLISFVGTGYSAFIDESAATARGILIRNTPNIMADAVAEHTVGLLIGLVRGLFTQNESVKRSADPIAPTPELRDVFVGIIGLGSIGSRVARVLVNGFGCRVAYHSRTPRPELERELRLEFLDLDALLRAVDAALLLVPTTASTVDLLDDKRLASVRPGLLLVNTAGARLVNPGALKAALEAGHVRAAAFDGYWLEPLPTAASDPWGFLRLPDDKFIVTPHTAAKTHSAWPRMIAAAVDNVVNEFVSEAK